MLNLSILLEDSASNYADQEAFAYLETSLNYKQVNEQANQVANGLKKIGIKQGDKVALTCINSPQFPIIYFGILKAGGVVVPLSILLKEEEVIYHLTNCEAKAYFCFTGTPQLPMSKIGLEAFNKIPTCKHFFMIMPEIDMPTTIEGTQTLGDLVENQPTKFTSVETNENDVAVIIYTSGTTGRPKGAQLTHSNLVLNAMLSVNLLETKHTDVQILALPLFHIFALTVLLNAGVYRGAKNVLVSRFTPKGIFTTMEKHKVSLFAGVPTMFWSLLNYHNDTFDFDDVIKNLRIAVSSGASLPVKILEDFENRFEVTVLEGYGMSEGSPVVTFNQMHIGRKVGSIGTAVWGVSIKLVDTDGNEVVNGEKGELIYKGHNVMKGYYNNPEANAKTIKDGWLYSGDVAIKDDDGFYFIVDRIKDLIIRGGLNVYPREVEEAMMKHEAISLVAIIGVPHDKMGEDIKAFVVLKEGYHVTSKELITWTRKRVAAYKYPRIIEFLDTLPMSATGKILKKELKQM